MSAASTPYPPLHAQISSAHYTGVNCLKEHTLSHTTPPAIRVKTEFATQQTKSRRALKLNYERRQKRALMGFFAQTQRLREFFLSG